MQTINLAIIIPAMSIGLPASGSKGTHHPPSTVSLTVQGSSAEWAGGRASRRVSRTRRSEDCICHPGSDMEHITPVGQWSQAESKQNNDRERKLISARLDATSQSSQNQPAVRLDGTVTIHIIAM